MIERWKRALDQNKYVGAVLTDLSKAFDCLNHQLLRAKLEAYGFGKEALNFIYNYLYNRNQRTKVNLNIVLGEKSNLVFHKDLSSDPCYLIYS